MARGRVNGKVKGRADGGTHNRGCRFGVFAARRELRHLYRLRKRDDLRSRISAALRAAMGFASGFIAASKLAIATTLKGKLFFAVVSGLVFLMPPLALALLLAAGLALIALTIISEGACLECCCFNGSQPSDCDIRNKRRRKLDSMIAEREAVIGASSLGLRCNPATHKGLD
jgi:hypothetical protein